MPRSKLCEKGECARADCHHEMSWGTYPMARPKRQAFPDAFDDLTADLRCGLLRLCMKQGTFSTLFTRKFKDESNTNHWFRRDR